MFKKRLAILLVLAGLAALVLAACAQSSAPGASNPQAPGAITIVQNYYAAIKANQLDIVMSFYADDALLTTPQGKYQGKAAIRPYMKSLLDQGYYSENSNYRESSGEVRYDYKVYLGSALVDQNNDGLTIVKNGKIVFDGLESHKPST